MDPKNRRTRALERRARYLLTHPEAWVPPAEAMERVLVGTACPHGNGIALECRECGGRVLARQALEALYERLGTTPEVARQLAQEADARHYGPPAERGH